MSQVHVPSATEKRSMHIEWKNSILPNAEATKYLLGRGVSSKDIDFFGLRYNTISRRILFKVEDFIQGRSIDESVKLKYMNSYGPNGKPLLVFKNNSDPDSEVFLPTLLVEGLYDAITLSHLCNNVVAVFGSKLSPNQKLQLLHVASSEETKQGIVIWFDEDAFYDALSLAYMINNNKGTSFAKMAATTNKEDPNNLGVAASRAYLKCWFPDSCSWGKNN